MSYDASALRVFSAVSRKHLTCAASTIALLTAMPAAAFAADAPQSAQGPASTEEIVVTGSRIVRNGYEAPTPVTVVGAEQLQDAAKPNVADVLNEMPAFQNSLTPSTSGAQNPGQSGGNNLNLRNFDPTRTLILFDGRRFPPSFYTNVVDINLMPDALISRVDVVTGGASAVYGSDAVAGVVNFVLDHNFTGVKGMIQGGVSGKGDGRNYKIQLAAGTTFADGKGHFVIEGDNSHQAQVLGTQRDWNQSGYFGIQNPAYTATNGLPQFVYRYNVGLTSGYQGGIISAGALKGIAFGPGGVPFNYDYGTGIVGSSFHEGGDWKLSTEAGGTNIMVGSNTVKLFTEASYDITDDIQIYAQFNNADNATGSRCCYVYYLGNLTVHPDNPYMPSTVAARATALGLTNIPFGITIHSDPAYGNSGGFGQITDRLTDIYVFGGKGKFDAFDTKWSWNAYVQRGISKQSFWVPFQNSSALFMQSIDAVRGANGQIICRSTLTNPNDHCVPYNLFGGSSVVSKAAFDYSFDGPRESETQGQNAAGVSATGEPFSTWAGPISVAVDAEYRKDTIRGRSDPTSAVIGWYSTQLNAYTAQQHVIEGALETVVPLAKGESWAKALDLNGAVRLTDYSVSGSVVTWKAGLSYQPIDDLRLRFVQSRDIRAPTLNDMFAAPQSNHSAIADPAFNNATYPYYHTIQGNPNLKPEKADTTGIGAIYQPSWFSGFSASVDFYRINLKGAIITPAEAYVLNQCYTGVTAYCQYISRFADGTLNLITQVPVNQAHLLAKGIDYEASYQTALSDVYAPLDGNLSIRTVATNTMHLITDTGIPGPTQVLDAAGYLAVPKWGITTTVTYSLDAFRVTWTGKYVSPTKVNNTYIECQTNCPNRPGFTTVDDNSREAYFLQNLSINYRFYQEGQHNAELYFTVDNLFDQDPPLGPSAGGNTYGVIANAALYDTMGRMFRAGLRFRM